MDWVELATIFCAWSLYFAIHSLAASLTVKRWVARRWPHAMVWYRIAFNLLAVLLLIAPAYLTWRAMGDPLWQWQGVWRWVSWAITAAVAFAFVQSLRYYDGKEFLGLRQLSGKVRSVEDQESLHISPFHRFVRHPWYTMGLALVWCRDMDPATLTATTAITLYFIIGSRLEERKLLVYHGERYRRYREQVPGLVPRPWRYLTRAETEVLQRAEG